MLMYCSAFDLHFGRGLLRRAQIIEHQHVGIRGRRGLLEAAVGHAQDAVQAFDDLAHHAGIDLDLDRLRAGDGLRRDLTVLPDRVSAASRSDCVKELPCRSG